MRKPRFVSPGILLAASVAALVSVLPAPAQTVYGSIVGTVTDATGATVPAANVTVTNLGTNEVRAVATGADGNYVFVNLLPGNYSVSVEKPGFRRLVRQPVTIEVQASVRIDAS